MPLPSSHAARLHDPSGYDSFKTYHPEGFPEGVDAILGLKGEGDAATSEMQSIHFDASKFTPDEAKAWLKEHEMEPILFEEASGQEKSASFRFAFKNIAQDEATETLFVSGPVLLPEIFDGQAEIASADVIKKIMRRFLHDYQNGLACLADHHGKDGIAIAPPGTLDFWISQSYQSATVEKRGDDEYPVGTWFMEWGIDEPESKKMVLDGTRNGFSIGGIGLYEELPDDA